ncbi:MAG: hypothetical protein CMB64_03620 [Euryarchaeota archaeon]|nr:hypothetical protein [Euryarchaeota archaeon]
MVKLAYYPGNVARAASIEVEDCIQPLCSSLGIELIEIPKATSDGGNIISQASPLLQHALVARNMALAESFGLDIMTTCASSHGIHCDTIEVMTKDTVINSKINSILSQVSNVEFSGESNSRHLLHVLVEDIGLEKISSLVKNPLRMNVAGYYGPNMQKKSACSKDNVFNPNYLEQLILALGGNPIEYDLKCQSVGAPALLTNQSSALKMTAAVLSDAKENGAQLMVSACTLSHSNLDTYQVKARRKTGKDTSMPVIHLAEMVAFALGHHKDRFAQLKTRVMVIGG